LDVNNSDKVLYLPDLLLTNHPFDESFLSIYTYKYDADGITFNNEYGYKLENEGF